MQMAIIADDLTGALDPRSTRASRLVRNASGSDASGRTARRTTGFVKGPLFERARCQGFLPVITGRASLHAGSRRMA